MTSFVAFSDGMLNTNSGYGGYSPGLNAREVVPVASLNNVYTGYVQASIVIKSMSGTSGTLASCYIGGSGGGTNNVNFNGDQAKVKWSGSGSLALSGATTYTASDNTATFYYDPTKPLVISLFFTGTNCTAASVNSSIGANTNNYQSSGGNPVGGSDESGNTSISGTYTGDTFFSWVQSITLTEVAAPGGPFGGQPPPIWFNAQAYRDPSNIHAANAALYAASAATVEYGETLNITLGPVSSYVDRLIPPLNLSLYALPPVANPFFGLTQPAPFNALSYLDRFFDGTAILPNIVQCAVQSTLGAPFDSKSYLNRFFDSSAFLPNVIQGQVATYFGGPFNPGSYRDTFFDGNAFLPSIIQGEIQSSLGAPFNALSYRDSFVRPLNIGLYPPSVIANPFSLPPASIPFNTLSYRDSFLPSANANLYPPGVLYVAGASYQTPFDAKNYRDPYLPSVNPNLFPPAAVGNQFFGRSLDARFNPQAYRDSYFSFSAFLPNTIQGQVQAYLGGPFNPQAYHDTFFDGSAFLPNIIQGQISSYLGAPFNTLAYQEPYRQVKNPNLYPPPVGTPFPGLSLPTPPFNPFSYRDTFFDGSAFLPSIIQGEVQAYLGAPFNPFNYRDLFFDGSAFLPSIIQTPTATFLNVLENAAPFNPLTYRDTHFEAAAFLPTLPAVPPSETFLNLIENAAPFRALSYRDPYVFGRLPGLYPPPVETPFANPFPFVKFDAKWYTDTSADLKNAFLPSIIQGQVQAYFGSPFNTVSYRDTAHVANAFLPTQIQGQVQAYFGAPFNALSYRDTSEFQPFPPRTTQPPVGYQLGVPFNADSYRDTAEYPPHPFLPRTIQGPVSSTLGAPFRPLSYRDSFVVGPNQAFYPPLTVGYPFFNPWLTVPFNPQAYQEEVWCPRDAVNIVSLCVGQDQTIRIALQDGFGNWLQPPFDIGWFDISLNGQPVLERNTNGQNARLISFVTGQWYLEINFRKEDTRHIPIGWYSYNSFLGDVPLEAGLLQMMDCSIPISVKRDYPPPFAVVPFSPPPPFMWVQPKRNYPVEPIPPSTFVPFSNPTQIARFNPMIYIDEMFWANGILP